MILTQVAYVRKEPSIRYTCCSSSVGEDCRVWPTSGWHHVPKIHYSGPIFITGAEIIWLVITLYHNSASCVCELVLFQMFNWTTTNPTVNSVGTHSILGGWECMWGDRRWLGEDDRLIGNLAWCIIASCPHFRCVYGRVGFWASWLKTELESWH